MKRRGDLEVVMRTLTSSRRLFFAQSHCHSAPTKDARGHSDVDLSIAPAATLLGERWSHVGPITGAKTKNPVTAVDAAGAANVRHRDTATVLDSQVRYEDGFIFGHQFRTEHKNDGAAEELQVWGRGRLPLEIDLCADAAKQLRSEALRDFGRLLLRRMEGLRDQL